MTDWSSQIKQQKLQVSLLLKFVTLFSNFSRDNHWLPSVLSRIIREDSIIPRRLSQKRGKEASGKRDEQLGSSRNASPLDSMVRLLQVSSLLPKARWLHTGRVRYLSKPNFSLAVVKEREIIYISVGVNWPVARFSKAPEPFRARQARAKSRKLIYSHILNMNRGSLYTRSFRRIHFSVFRYRWTKNGFMGPKSFRGFLASLYGSSVHRTSDRTPWRASSFQEDPKLSAVYNYTALMFVLP